MGGRARPFRRALRSSALPESRQRRSNGGQKNAPTYAVIVAGLAVVVSGIMQYFTLKMSRQNVVTGLRVGAVESAVVTLRNTISEYIPVSYKMKLHEMEKRTEGPGLPAADIDKLSADEAKMFGMICMSLDPKKPSHTRLLAAITHLRDQDIFQGGDWSEKRDRIFERMRDLSYSEREETLGGDTLNVVNFSLLNSVANQTKNQIYKCTNRIVMFLTKADQLRK